MGQTKYVSVVPTNLGLEVEVKAIFSPGMSSPWMIQIDIRHS